MTVPFDLVGRMDQAFAREVLGVWPPESAPGACRLCAEETPHMDVACTASSAYSGRTAKEVVQGIDATVEGRCAGPGCGILLTADSPSGWWCSPECQAAYQAQGAIRPHEVRGSRGVAEDAARWRPDLESDLAVFDAAGLQLVTVRPVGGQLVQRTYRRAGSDVWWFRLDDGHRFVGLDVAPEVVRDREARQAVWDRLERELTDPRRLDPDPVRSEIARQGSELFDRWLAETYGHSAGREAEQPQGWYWCDTCQRTGEPELESDDLDRLTFRAERLQQRRPRCPNCHATVPQDLRLTVQQEDDGCQLLRVERGGRLAEHRLSGGYLREASDPQALILRTPNGGSSAAVVAEAFNRAGEAIRGFAVPLAATGEALRRAVADEEDRVALRAVCGDEAEYERALQAARDHGLTVREVAEMLAAGRAIGDRGQQ